MHFISCKTASPTSQHRVRIHYDRSTRLACVLIPHLRGRSMWTAPPTRARGWTRVSAVFLFGWLSSAQSNEIPPGDWPRGWLACSPHITAQSADPTFLKYHPHPHPHPNPNPHLSLNQSLVSYLVAISLHLPMSRYPQAKIHIYNGAPFSPFMWRLISFQCVWVLWLDGFCHDCDSATLAASRFPVTSTNR